MIIDVVIADRNSAAGATREIEFEDFDALKEQVQGFMESLPFHRISVELIPVDFEPTEEQDILIRDIEGW